MWAITCYYNPEKYFRRRQNFQVFRRRLGVPLLAVELTFDGSFDLGVDDADVVVRVSGGSVLWQKERLLNVALGALPRSVDLVAWLDCDVVFSDPDWHLQASERLKSCTLIQLFSELVDLHPSDSRVDSTNYPALQRAVTGRSIVWLNKHSKLVPSNFSPSNTQDMRTACFGLAWAGHRHLLRRHGFYDAMIVGSGDRSMVCAMYGRFADVIRTLELNPDRAAHYLEWAEAFHTAAGENVECLPGTLFHLWHGDIEHRNYRDRHSRFAIYPFSPSKNLLLSPSGAWQLVGLDPSCQEFLKSYFRERREDG